jgi:elongation factor Ts
MTASHRHRHLSSYVHNGKIGVLLEIAFDSDVLVRMEEIQGLIRDIGLQIAAMAPLTVDDLLLQPFVKDDSQTIGQLIAATSQKMKEQIAVTRFVRWSADESEMPEFTDSPEPPRTPAVIMLFRRGG